MRGYGNAKTFHLVNLAAVWVMSALAVIQTIMSSCLLSGCILHANHHRSTSSYASSALDFSGHVLGGLWWRGPLELKEFLRSLMGCKVFLCQRRQGNDSFIEWDAQMYNSCINSCVFHFLLIRCSLWKILGVLPGLALLLPHEGCNQLLSKMHSIKS